MKPTVNPPVRPLITPEQMQRILANRRPITSAEAHRQMLVHLGRLPAGDVQPTQADAPARDDARPDTLRSESLSNPRSNYGEFALIKRQACPLPPARASIP